MLHCFTVEILLDTMIVGREKVYLQEEREDDGTWKENCKLTKN